MKQTDPGDYTILESGPTSTVYRTWAAIGTPEPQLVAIKQASTVKSQTRCPHDILKELDILRSISHLHIVPVLDIEEDTIEQSIQFWMPYLPISLSDLLASPKFTPGLFSGESNHPQNQESLPEDQSADFLQARKQKSDTFRAICQSIMLQTLLAVEYLHNTAKVAHRDIKPGNILMTKTGCVKLIDFGISYQDDASQGDFVQPTRTWMWPESYQSNTMHFEVCTGPYRAPELLFGTRQYDAYAVDIWSLGAVFAEFFRPLRLNIEDDEDEDDEEDEEDDPSPADPNTHTPGFIYPKGHPREPRHNAKWTRDTLFDGTRGEIGLAWSIFKIKGTPTEQTWPDFEKLPHAGGVRFTVVPEVLLAPLLPHLPEKTPWTEEFGSLILDLIQHHLSYVPSTRIKPSEALQHAFFRPQVLFPDDYPPAQVEELRKSYGSAEPGWKPQNTLGELLDQVIAQAEEDEDTFLLGAELEMGSFLL